jgi:hypothetical protein
MREGYPKETRAELFLSLDNTTRVHLPIGELDVNEIRHGRLPHETMRTMPNPVLAR